MYESILARAAQLEAEGEPFVLATVVWSRGPSSGKQGSKALIDPTGKVEGWLGGACAEPSVVAEARSALGDGQPRLMFVGPADELERGHRDGVAVVPMACESEGSLEVYLEPVLPQPSVVVIGRSPAVDTLAQLAQAIGWRSVVVDDQGSEAQHDFYDVVTNLEELPRLVDKRSFVVVATQGHYDEVALQRALATKAGYVGLVSSRKRSDSVLEFLRAKGVHDADLARVHAPAGIDLGHVGHEGIAVSVLAELVAARAAGAVTAGVEVDEPETAIDPVCGMTVDVASARFVSEHQGTTYYFCAPGCQRAFEADPAQFV